MHASEHIRFDMQSIASFGSLKIIPSPIAPSFPSLDSSYQEPYPVKGNNWFTVFRVQNVLRSQASADVLPLVLQQKAEREPPFGHRQSRHYKLYIRADEA